MKREITTLFKDLCCSVCRSDFDENSVVIMRQEDSQEEEILVFKLVCQNCGKSFGVAFMGISNIELKDCSEDDITLRVTEGADPISADDVLNAHEFIKNLDENWPKFINDMVDK